MLTGFAVEASSCCSEASGRGCPNGDVDATLTSAAGAECKASCEKGCCKEKADAVDITESQEAIAPEGPEVVAELTEAE